MSVRMIKTLIEFVTRIRRWRSLHASKNSHLVIETVELFTHYYSIGSTERMKQYTTPILCHEFLYYEQFVIHRVSQYCGTT